MRKLFKLTKAVDALKRISTNDDVRDGSAVVEDEDSVAAASVLVGVAWLATVKLLVLEVLATSDGARRWERDDGTRAGRNVESLRSRHAGNEREKGNLGNHGGGVCIEEC